MIEVIKALQRKEYYGKSECINIAKGKYELVTDWKGILEKAKRLAKSK